MQPLRERLAEPLLALLLLLGYGWLFVYFERLNNPNEMVRIYMIRALVEEHGYAIGRRVSDGHGHLVDTGALVRDWGYVNDRALVCDDAKLHPPQCAGTLYSVKAPGTSFLGVPVFAAERALTKWIAHRAPSKGEAVFFLRFFLIILPSIVLWMVVRRYLLGWNVPRPVALATTLAGALGSLSLTYGRVFAGHQLSGLALMLAFLVSFPPLPIVETSAARRRSLWVGVGLGLGLLMDYQSAPAALLLFVSYYRDRRPGWRELARLAVGALPSLALLAHYHTCAFGAPWRAPYAFQENASFAKVMDSPLLSISWPTADSVAGSLVSPFTGLFYWAPWTALVLAAPFLLRRPGGRDRRVAATAFAVVLYYLVFQITQTVWRGGWTLGGPRYITPLVPFAVIAIALGLARLGDEQRVLWQGVFAGAAATSMAAIGLAGSVAQGFPSPFYNPLVEAVIPLLRHGYMTLNLLQWAGVGGIQSAAPYFLALAVATLLVLGSPLCLPATGRRRLIGLAIAIGLAVALTTMQWTTRHAPGAASPTAAELAQGMRILTEAWQPDPPPGARPFFPPSPSVKR